MIKLFEESRDSTLFDTGLRNVFGCVSLGTNNEIKKKKKLHKTKKLFQS